MMKNLWLIFAVFFLLSCSKDEPTDELIGTWRLVEILADPGDGSGTFRSVDSKKTITFHSNGTIVSNGSLCLMNPEVENSTSGTYSEAESTYSSDDCAHPDYKFSFEKEGLFLIINYPCIEPCRAKFKKQ